MAFRLPRLMTGAKIVNTDGTVSLEFQRWWQSMITTLESHEGYQDAILAAQTAANTANAAAAVATAAAATANTTADAITQESNLVNSYVTGLSLGATDAGASASISISAHTRVYGDGTSVSVNAGSFTGLAYSTTYYVYYDDAARTGGAVTYAQTTTAATAAQTGDRHLVGSVLTPAAAAGPTTGGGVLPPGIGDLP